MKSQKRLALSSSKGFTIIELIVVIAIIAALAAIVLVNVTQYINKSRNASIKANLAGLLTDGTVYFESDPVYKGSYQGFCDSSNVASAQTAVANAGGTDLVCKINNGLNTKWCACAQEIATTATFCVDSTGYKQETNTACASRCFSGSCTS